MEHFLRVVRGAIFPQLLSSFASGSLFDPFLCGERRGGVES